MKMTLFSCLACALLSAARGAETAAPPPGDFGPPPGAYRTSWVGNSFGGGQGENGFGEWIQDGVDEIDVAPDGTVLAGVEWDEAGRCVGLYKDGRPNHVLLKAEGVPGGAWGWNTGNNALAVNGAQIVVANTGKQLVRFRWTPGDIDSAKPADHVALPDAAVGLAARGDRLAVVYKDAVEMRRVSDLGVVGRFAVSDGRDAAIAPDGSVWLLAGGAVRHISAAGADSGARLAGVGRPSALAWDNRGRLIVCDDGPAQQVLFFDVSRTPRLVDTFGDKGGLLSGTPGQVAPRKLFALRGAGTDAQGNLYVALSFGNGPNGNCFLRSFTPGGRLRWERMNASFVDTYGFLPDSDGAVVYGRTTRYDLDLSKAAPGAEATLRAVTVDPLNSPKDERLRVGCTALARTVGGRRVLYTIGQYGGGYRIHTFAPGSEIARPVDQILGDDQWAWDVDAKGDIWHGDGPGRLIRRYPFGGWGKDARPKYDWAHPQTWPWPEDFQRVTRLLYEPRRDALYLFGYLKGQTVDSWGLVGWTARRIDGWLGGKATARWTNTRLPVNPHGEGDKPLTPKGVALAGDYLFFGMVKPDEGRQYTHVLSAADGRRVGAFKPGPEVGGNAGWEDMPYSLQALKRKNGEYLILVEEDWRGKNLLYRWRPEGRP